MTGPGEDWVRLIEKDLRDLEADVKNLVAWRNWVLGSVAGVGFVVGMLAKPVAHIVFGTPP